LVLGISWLIQFRILTVLPIHFQTAYLKAAEEALIKGLGIASALGVYYPAIMTLCFAIFKLIPSLSINTKNAFYCTNWV
jgi:hypothetical protein